MRYLTVRYEVTGWTEAEVDALAMEAEVQASDSDHHPDATFVVIDARAMTLAEAHASVLESLRCQFKAKVATVLGTYGQLDVDALLRDLAANIAQGIAE